MPWIPTPSGGGGSSPLTTKGDVYTYDTADARLPVGSDGQVLTADSAQGTGLAWQTPSGGGGGGSSPVWVDYLSARQAGETAHTDDKFFSGAAPAAASSGTAVTPTGTATWVEGYDLLSGVVSTQTSGDQCGYVWPITSAAAPMTIETHMSVALRRGNNPMGGLVFSGGATTSSGIVSVGPYTSSAANAFIGRWSGTFTGASTTNVFSDLSPATAADVYLRLVWTATNTWAWAVSPDGVGWSDFGATTFSVTLAPTHFGVWASTWGLAYPIPFVFHYVRVTDADLSV